MNNQSPQYQPWQRSALIRRSALVGTGVMVAGVVGTAALAAGLSQSVNSATPSGSAGQTTATHNSHKSAKSTNQQSRQTSTGLVAPQAAAPVSGGSNGS